MITYLKDGKTLAKKRKTNKEEKEKSPIEMYQCLGCTNYPYPQCFKKSDIGIGCDKHSAGTTIGPSMSRIFLGLPKGLCKLGPQRDMRVYIFENFEQQNQQWKYDKFNIPVWKYKDEHNHIIIRGYMPRLNKGFIHIILSGDFGKLNCFEITDKDLEEMD